MNFDNRPEVEPFKFTKKLEDSKLLLNEMDKLLSLQEETKKLKTRRQFDEWNRNVHGAIMNNITERVNGMNAKELNEKRNNDYSKFLDTTNRKSAIFRDIIIESEYDPLEVNRNCIKVVTKKLRDPCKIDKRKQEEENSMLKTSKSNNSNSMSSSQLLSSASLMNKTATTEKLRDMLPVQDWASGKIEATPHGMFSKQFSGSTTISNDSLTKPKKTNKSNESKVVFDHFNAPKGLDAVNREMPRGKKTFPEKS